MGTGRGFLFLVVLVAALGTQMGTPVIDLILLPLVVGLLAAHLDREGGRLARALVRAAVRLLPVERREDEEDVWIDHVETAGEEGVLPLTRALSIACIAAPLLAIGLRVGRRRHRVSR